MGQKPWVILLHCFGGSIRTWAEVSEGLAGLGARPMAIDLPGFGSAADDEPSTIDAMVEKVIAAVHALRAG